MVLSKIPTKNERTKDINPSIKFSKINIREISFLLIPSNRKSPNSLLRLLKINLII